MEKLKYLALATIAAVIFGCSSGPEDKPMADTGTKTPEDQLGQSQKGDFKPVPDPTPN